jgi:hypothetical protein
MNHKIENENGWEQKPEEKSYHMNDWTRGRTFKPLKNDEKYPSFFIQYCDRLTSEIIKMCKSLDKRCLTRTLGKQDYLVLSGLKRVYDQFVHDSDRENMKRDKGIDPIEYLR